MQSWHICKMDPNMKGEITQKNLTHSSLGHDKKFYRWLVSIVSILIILIAVSSIWWHVEW